MARQIRVPPQFRADFDYYCDCAGLDAGERAALRDEVRGNFEVAGTWVTEAAAVYRFCDRQWCGVPTLDQVDAYLAAQAWQPMDPTIFQRFGILLLARVCASVAGVIPMPVDA